MVSVESVEKTVWCDSSRLREKARKMRAYLLVIYCRCLDVMV